MGIIERGDGGLAVEGEEERGWGCFTQACYKPRKIEITDLGGGGTSTWVKLNLFKNLSVS